MSPFLEKEGDRPDQTLELGHHLTTLETLCYSLIHDSGEELISGHDLYTQLSEVNPNSNHSDDPVAAIRNLIIRIRKKLGANSIITAKHGGYATRRAIIEANTGNRDPQEVVEELRHELQGKADTST